jgi:hypothetical protein
MIRKAAIATAAPISNDLSAREKARLPTGESRLYRRVPDTHVMSMRTEISVASIKNSLQCTRRASTREADGASAVTGNRRGVDMAATDESLS